MRRKSIDAPNSIHEENEVNGRRKTISGTSEAKYTPKDKGFLSFFKKNPHKKRGLSFFKKDLPYFPPVSPRSAAIHSDRLPTEISIPRSSLIESHISQFDAGYRLSNISSEKSAGRKSSVEEIHLDNELSWNQQPEYVVVQIRNEAEVAKGVATTRETLPVKEIIPFDELPPPLKPPPIKEFALSEDFANTNSEQEIPLDECKPISKGPTLSKELLIAKLQSFQEIDSFDIDSENSDSASSMEEMDPVISTTNDYLWQHESVDEHEEEDMDKTTYAVNSFQQNLKDMYVNSPRKCETFEHPVIQSTYQEYQEDTSYDDEDDDTEYGNTTDAIKSFNQDFLHNQRDEPPSVLPPASTTQFHFQRSFNHVDPGNRHAVHSSFNQIPESSADDSFYSTSNYEEINNAQSHQEESYLKQLSSIAEQTDDYSPIVLNDSDDETSVWSGKSKFDLTATIVSGASHKTSVQNNQDHSIDPEMNFDYEDSVGSPTNSITLDDVYETTYGSSHVVGESVNLPHETSSRPPSNAWYPAPALLHVREMDLVLADFTGIVKTIHQQKNMSKETLEIRAGLPEYRLEKADWLLAKKQRQSGLATVQCVARVPIELLEIDSTTKSSQASHRKRFHEGYLLKRGELNVSMQRRYMILEENELIYYKTNPERNKGWFGKENPRGSLHMGNVSLVRPHLDTLTMELVTTKRTWVLQAETEKEYRGWARAICHSVPYHAIDIVFRRMFQLAEVDASDVNEVRLSTLSTFTVEETVDHIFINYVQMVGSLPLKPFNPSNYFLKVTGYRDYMVNPKSTMDQYSHVQECIFSKKTLCLTVVNRELLSQSLQDAALLDAKHMETMMRAQESKENLPKPQAIIPSGSCDQSLSISVHQISKFNAASNTHAVVAIELFYGAERLEKIAETAEVALTVHKLVSFGNWPKLTKYVSQLPVCNLPRETRLIFTVYGFTTSQTGKWTPLMSGGVNLFDQDGYLAQGEKSIPLVDHTDWCDFGPLPQNLMKNSPSLQIFLPLQRTPIKFDWTANIAPVPTRNVSLDRSGWLLERQSNALPVVWNQKWCRLDQENCCLYLTHESDTTGITISLDSVIVKSMSTMNQRHTTKLTSSTRREEQTWAFQLQIPRKSKVYVFAAKTRHERDAWMNTIHLAASRIDLIDALNSNCGDEDTAERASFLEEFVQPVGIAASADLGSFSYLTQLIQENPLYKLSGFEKAILWHHRRAFMGSFQALPRILSCVNWLDPQQVIEIRRLLPSWTTPRYLIEYIALFEYVDLDVRAFAVKQLSTLTDSMFRQYIPQFIQAIKMETYTISPLVNLLIERALKNPNQIGFDFYWGFQVETYHGQANERFGILLNAFVDVCSLKTRRVLEFQDKLFAENGQLSKIAREIQHFKHSGVSDKEVLVALHEKLYSLNAALPESFQLPNDPRIEVGKIIVANCRVMSSAKMPLWLEFENAQIGQQSISVIFKCGDDLRQDMLILQLLRVMDEIWRQDGKDMTLEPYRCVATGPSTGLVQVVPFATTTADIQRRGKGIFGAFNDECFLHWIKEHNTTPRLFKNALDRFMRSCAGYCVATYVLGIGDRHNDNIMLTNDGHFFHVDFGHILGFFKYVPLLGITIKRERTPFVFTPQMSSVFGGEQSPNFLKFIKLAGDAFNILRKHFHLFVNLFLLMLPANLPELRSRQDISYFIETIAPDMTPTDAFQMFEQLIRQCHQCKWKQYDNAAHLAYHNK